MATNGAHSEPKVKMSIPKPPEFSDKQAEREYLKGRLAAAFRIFGKYGFDEGTSPLPQYPILPNKKTTHADR